MAEIFTVPAILTRISSRVDGGLSVGFTTQELTADDKLTAFKFQNQFGRLLFRANEAEFTEEEIPDEDVEDGSKSQAQRLRNVFYVYWVAHKKGKVDFQTFYRAEMEAIIDTVKERLE